tara:strand:- start:682 stop:1656 length:975 start_codon:yes stop_codon:yes gene_type:complete
MADGKISLPDHYKASLAPQGIKPSELPDNLYFTFCGDILGSGGEHYEKGKDFTLTNACHMANLHYSDDYAESLAMHQLAEQGWSCDLSPEGLLKGRDDFLNIIRGHYIAYGLQYSPWAAALFEEKKPDNLKILLSLHSSCGATMRAAALAPHDLTLEQVFPFFAITHTNLQAVEAGYMTWAFAKALLDGYGFYQAYERSLTVAQDGRKLASEWLRKYNVPVKKDQSVTGSVIKVLDTQNPYAVTDDMKEDGIESHFVQSSVMLILSQIMDKGMEKNGAQYVVEQSLKIGGDPDTICSIAMSLFGLQHPDLAKFSLSEIHLPVTN